LKDVRKFFPFSFFSFWHYWSELRALCLLGRCSTTWTTSPDLQGILKLLPSNVNLGLLHITKIRSTYSNLKIRQMYEITIFKALDLRQWMTVIHERQESNQTVPLLVLMEIPSWEWSLCHPDVMEAFGYLHHCHSSHPQATATSVVRGLSPWKPSKIAGFLEAKVTMAPHLSTAAVRSFPLSSLFTFNL
jgi:hypothetical protein